MAFKYYHAFLCFLLLISIAAPSKAQNAKALLLKNVDSIPMPPSPMMLSFFTTVNNQPDIIAMAAVELAPGLQGSAIMASTFGKGKLLLLGSTAYFKEPMLKNGRVAQLFKNTLGWAGNGKQPMRVAVADNANKGLCDFLVRQKAAVHTLKNFDLSHTDILILTDDLDSFSNIKQLETFVDNGGTLIFGSPYWDLFNTAGRPKPDLYHKLTINAFFAKAGLINNNLGVVASPANKKLLTGNPPDYLHIKTLLPRLLRDNKTDLDYYIDEYFVKPMLNLVFKYNAPGSAFIAHIKQSLNVPDVLPIPSPVKPVANNTPALKAAAKIGYLLYSQQLRATEQPTAKAPGYDVFPGAVSDTAARVNQIVYIPVMVGTQGLYDMPSVYCRPHSTGLYVPAGEKVTITLNAADIKQGLKAQIGVHDDNVTHLDEFKRIPLDLTKTFDLDKEKTEIYSPYGGLLLINIADTSKLKNVSIKVSGTVKAPYFKLGETSEKDWISNIRNNPAPWAELATDKIVLTVPSYRIRNLTNPVKLMQFWDEVMDADADLAIISKKRAHQERIIVDVDVAYGYMFTQPYKIVGPDDEGCGQMLDEAYMRATGLWGHFHEIGHRHQFFDLDMPGTSEVTVNLYTMYVYDKVLHKGIYQHEGMMSKAEVITKIKTYLADNPTYEKWSNDPFLALSMYIQIIDTFGWDAIKAANTVYRNLPADQYPKTEQDKRDLWFTTICKATNSNLSRFFNTWKIAVSDNAKKQAAGYKVWFPKELE